ncbi:MAG: hypothetical protein AAGK02_12435 [Pseudomonadota bacterium]
MARSIRFGALAGLAAAASMAATPAAAADLTPMVPAAPTQLAPQSADIFDYEAADTVEHHRYRRYRHRNRVDAGDVLAGVLIIGGIAAIASAASNDSKKNRDRDYDYRDRDRDIDYQRPRGENPRSSGTRGIDNAVSMCVAEIEQDIRVDSVDSVDRSGEGWLVTGALFNGDRFSCRINNSGRIESVDYDGRLASAPPARDAEDSQWSDASYYEARQRVEQAGPVDRSVDQREPEYQSAQPAYPGGPLPGEEIEDDTELGG